MKQDFRTLFASSPAALTDNGDVAHTTTGSVLLDLWSGMCRSTKGALSESLATDLKTKLPLAWAEDRILTIRLLFFKRDCRGGAGERDIFEVGFGWLVDTYPSVALQLMEAIPEYGSWRDLTKLSGFNNDNIAAVFSMQLSKDKTAVQKSLAAKWAPGYKQNRSLADAIAKQLFPKSKDRQKQYRLLLSKLRTDLKVVERLQSLNQWSQIEYKGVPSLAMNRYRKAFAKHDLERWNQYNVALLEKTTTVNSKQLMPHEILQQPLHEQLTISQWSTMVADIKLRGTLRKAVAMADVSESMNGTPMDVAIALGILVSECSTMQDLMISFTEKPRFFNLKGCTLMQKVENVRREKGYNTDLRGAFRVLLDRAVEMRLLESEMPETLLVISDMQFDNDAVSGGWDSSTYTDVCRMYTKKGYKTPLIVFWNVNGRLSSMPVTMLDRGVITISGWSQSLLEHVMSGDVSNPMAFMKSVLNRPRYTKLTAGLVWP